MGDRISGNPNRADREEVGEETGYIKRQIIWILKDYSHEEI